MSRSNILVLGSQGTIGRPLVEKLKSRGHQVYGADLMHVATKGPHTGYVRCDISDYRQLSELIDTVSPRYIYNCAAEFGRYNGEDYYEQMWRTNVIGLKHILTLQDVDKFRLIHFSSSEVYGDYHGYMYENVTNEKPIHQLNDYAMSKWVNEMQIRNAESETCIVRLFNTYGPGEYYHQYRGIVPTLIYNLLHNRTTPLYVNHQRSFTYIDDTIRTLANIIEQDTFPQTTVNIASKEVMSLDTMADIIADAVLGPGQDEATYSKRSLIVRMSTQEPFTTIRKEAETLRAQDLLAHQNTVDFRTGIRHTVDWMREVYK